MIPFQVESLNNEEESLKTCHDLSWAILNYGNKPEYRRKGEKSF